MLTPEEIKAAFSLIRQSLAQPNPAGFIEAARAAFQSQPPNSALGYECVMVCALLDGASRCPVMQERDGMLTDAVDREWHVLGALEWMRYNQDSRPSFDEAVCVNDGATKRGIGEEPGRRGIG